MPTPRVLIIDNSVTVRKRIRDAIEGSNCLTVSGVAANKSIALQKLTQDRPDVACVGLDLDTVDTANFVRELIGVLPNLRVVIFNVDARKGHSLVFASLSAGATGYVTKPSDSAAESEWGCATKDLIPKMVVANASAKTVAAPVAPSAGLKKLGAASGPVSTSANETAKTLELKTVSLANQIRDEMSSQTAKKYPKAFGPTKLVCIGSSTGGPNALAEVFENFEKNFPVPVVITQHMPPMFTGMLATRLNQFDRLVFHEAEHGEKLLAGHAYIAPGGKHMTVHRDASGMWAELNEEPPENSCRPAVDVMLRSVADNVGGNVLTVILTGMGKDGFIGCEYMKELGGTVYAQDEESSVVWGMPGYVATAGLADEVLPLGSVAPTILKHVTGKVVAGKR